MCSESTKIQKLQPPLLQFISSCPNPIKLGTGQRSFPAEGGQGSIAVFHNALQIIASSTFVLHPHAWWPNGRCPSWTNAQGCLRQSHMERESHRHRKYFTVRAHTLPWFLDIWALTVWFHFLLPTPSPHLSQQPILTGTFSP